MTDDELLRVLREINRMNPDDCYLQGHYFSRAADRIEQLVKERDEADARALRYKSERNGQARKISDAQSLDTASFEAERKIVNQRGEINMLQARAEAAEAKLAKAVAALRELREDAGNLGDNICYCQEAVDRDLHITAYRIGEDARAVLAELEKTE
jgi:seryl-tRNA synthetase